MATSEALPFYLFIHICHGCIVWEAWPCNSGSVWLFYIFAFFCMWGPTFVQPCPIRAPVVLPVLSAQMCYMWSTSGRLGSQKGQMLLGFQNTSKCIASLLLLSLTPLIPCAQIGGINFLDLPFFRQDKSSAVTLLAYFCLEMPCGWSKNIHVDMVMSEVFRLSWCRGYDFDQII